MATLDRLREIVKARRDPGVPVVADDAKHLPPARVGEGVAPILDGRLHGSQQYVKAALMLGGALLERPEGAVIVVDREYCAEMRHGHTAIGDIAATIHDGLDALRVMARAWPSAQGIDRRILFLDLETTGLFGGAGTQAFLVGCAVLEGESIRIRQFLLPGFEHERAVLGQFQEFAAAHGALCTYNGRSFDVPLVETRFLFHRAPCPLDGLPHLDMLHAARRLWRQRPLTMGTPDPDDSSCSLSVLEKHISGMHRVGDVPGYEIPSRFFQFVRDGDARPLEAVLEHNRLDLISLAAVLARAITLITSGPSLAGTAQEAYGLARVYERAGEYDNAEAALLRTIEFARRVGGEPEVQAEALRRLAWIRRRSRRLQEAAEAWQELAALPRCAASLRREATEALAIHHEHRSKNLDRARQHALELLTDPAVNPARVQHRLDRLERKLAQRSTDLLPIDY